MEVKVTGHSHSARSTLHYIFYGSYNPSQRKYNQAKANKNGITERNELVAGYRCHIGYKHALKDFKHYLKKKPNNKVQTLNAVLSFAKSDFDFRKPEDCFEAQTIGRDFVHRAFPNHQAVIALQQDNTRAIPHIHLIINAISMQPPYKTIPGGHSKNWYAKHPGKPYQPVNYGIEHLRHVGKQCLKDYGLGFHRSITGITQRGQSTSASLNHIQEFMRTAVSNVLREATNKRTFRAILRRRYGISASFKHHKTRRRRKRGRRRRRTRYKRDGVVFRYDEFRHDKNGNIVLRKSGKPRVHRHYLKSSTLARVDPELSYRSILGTLHQNGIRRQRQRSVSATSMASASTSASLSVSISYSPVASRNASASKARSRANSAFSVASLSISRRSSEAVSQAENIAIQPKWTSLTAGFGGLLNQKRSAEASERKRVSGIMPEFHSRKTQRYAWWNYGHAVPAYCIGRKVPEFAVNRADRSLLHRMTAPIINGFKHGKRWTLAKWNAGKKWMAQHVKMGFSYRQPLPPSKVGFISGKLDDSNSIIKHHTYQLHDFARIGNLITRPLRMHIADKFHQDWSGIKKDFHANFIEPIMARFNDARDRANSASYARAQVLSARSEAESKASTTAESQLSQAKRNQSRAVSLIDSESESTYWSSYNQTPAGQSSIAMMMSTINDYRSSKSSAHASKRASISASKASWTSSVAGLDYGLVQCPSLCR